MKDDPVIGQFAVTPAMPLMAVDSVMGDHPRLRWTDHEFAVRQCSRGLGRAGPRVVHRAKGFPLNDPQSDNPDVLNQPCRR